MEDWLYYSLSIFSSLVLFLLLSSLRRQSTGIRAAPPLPPGPSALLALGLLLFLDRSNFSIEPVIRVARARYGPVFALQLLPSCPPIFIADRAAAHRALVQRGVAFAGRPPANFPARVFSNDQHNITSSPYGALWRALRHNLTGKVLHPSRLLDGVARRMRGDGVVVVEGLLHRAMFQLLVGMCFGEGIDDATVASVEALQREFAASAIGFQVLGVWPVLARLVFRRRWRRRMSLRRRQAERFLPLIRARRRRGDDQSVDLSDATYVDSLLALRVPDGSGGRQLMEGEVVSLCSKFLTAGTDTTVAVAQWIMANLVAHQEIQAKLRAEIRDVTGGEEEILQEEQLSRMPYLRAVVLEALRRHPPGHFVLPHAATEDADGGGEAVTLEGFRVPARATVNFTVVEMTMDEAVWPDAGRFRPERFMPGGEGEDVDLTGSREIKMMPFGAGRRVCPVMATAMLHLEFFVASLVAEFEWRAVAGEEVDFAEKQELSVVMRRRGRRRTVPMRARNGHCVLLRQLLTQFLLRCKMPYQWLSVHMHNIKSAVSMAELTETSSQQISPAALPSWLSDINELGMLQSLVNGNCDSHGKIKLLQ